VQDESQQDKSRQDDSKVTRRTFVQGALAAGGLGLIGPVATAHRATAADPVEITDSAVSPSVVVVAMPDDGAVPGYFQILDRERKHRLTLTGVQLAYTVGTEKRTATTTGLSGITRLNEQQLSAEYRTSVDGVTVTGTFMAGLRKLRVRWDVKAPAPVRADGFRIGRTVVGTAVESYEPVALWNDDERGGVPYETTNGVLYAQTFADNRTFVRVPQSNISSSDQSWIHAVGTADGVDGSVEANVVLGVMRPHAAGIIARDSPIGVDLWTDDLPFNLARAAGSATVRIQVVNGATSARTVSVGWRTTSWSGVVQQGMLPGSAVGARAVWNTSVAVPLDGHDLRVLEVTVTDDASETAFARTTLATLETFPYLAREDSMFGLANYPYLANHDWIKHVNQADVLELMGLVGMRWVRTAYAGAPGIPAADLDAAGIEHNVQLGYLDADGKPPDDTAAWAAGVVDKCIVAGAGYYECGNELNLRGVTPASYINDALKPLDDAMKARSATFPVMTHGVAGFDEAWLQGFTEGWQYVDVLAYHPGRGNYVPDYDPPEPWFVDGVRQPQYWNFLGSLRKADDLAAAHGKELWLTEAYAPTQPNRWWTDTQRHAAENVLLQAALAKAHGVRGMTWYTLFDSIEHQPMEANPDNIEHHYGLLNRDLSPKPSLLAYATAARFLDQVDQATGFAGWADLSGASTGLVFDTPTGRVCLLWDRTDGYVLNNGRRDPANPTSTYYRTPELWEDTWIAKTRVTLDVAANRTSIREIDCIGMETVHAVTNGQVEVVLDGAPRIFIGLDVPVLEQTTTSAPEEI
jgi:hypothetical protein